MRVTTVSGLRPAGVLSHRVARPPIWSVPELSWRAVVGSQDFSYEQSNDSNGTVRIALRGELDIASAPSLEMLLWSHAASAVLLELEDLAFLDSMVVAVLVRAHRESKEAGGVLRFTSPGGEVRRWFEIMGLTQLLEFED
jgi:anti-sigma B factor antagonist